MVLGAHKNNFYLGPDNLFKVHTQTMRSKRQIKSSSATLAKRSRGPLREDGSLGELTRKPSECSGGHAQQTDGSGSFFRTDMMIFLYITNIDTHYKDASMPGYWERGEKEHVTELGFNLLSLIRQPDILWLKTNSIFG